VQAKIGEETERLKQMHASELRAMKEASEREMARMRLAAQAEIRSLQDKVATSKETFREVINERDKALQIETALTPDQNSVESVLEDITPPGGASGTAELMRDQGSDTHKWDVSFANGTASEAIVDTAKPGERQASEGSDSANQRAFEQDLDDIIQHGPTPVPKGATSVILPSLPGTATAPMPPAGPSPLAGSGGEGQPPKTAGPPPLPRMGSKGPPPLPPSSNTPPSLSGSPKSLGSGPSPKGQVF